jgi:hypothetical protein
MDDAEGAEGGADGAFAACSADSIEGAGRSANTTSNLTTNLDICRTISSALIPLSEVRRTEPHLPDANVKSTPPALRLTADLRDARSFHI